MDLRDKLIVLAKATEYGEEAERLANHLGVSFYTGSADVPDNMLMLIMDEEGLALSDGDMVLRADLTRMIPRLKQSNLQNEMLVKATRIKGTSRGLNIIDATAGFGEDSLLLAAAGNYITLYEYDPIIAALLRDGLRKAAQVPTLDSIVARMKLIEGNSIVAMEQMKGDNTVDVILLDPMFPERQKSASVKKKFQLLQQLESPCSDEYDLLQAAMDVRPSKLVIKRPVKGPYLGNKKPDYSYAGKAIRYDCFSFVKG